jgi:hypothetical protein
MAISIPRMIGSTSPQQFFTFDHHSLSNGRTNGTTRQDEAMSDRSTTMTQTRENVTAADAPPP